MSPSLRKTKDELVVSHIPLVKAIANRLIPRNRNDSKYWNETRDAMIGDGMIALIQAAETFDPGRGVPFGAYARKGVRGAMTTYLRRNDSETVSLDGKDIDGVPYLDSIGNDGQPEVIALRDALKHHLHPVEEWVVTRRYFGKESLEDMANELGFKVSRVSQIHNNALRKLRKAFGPTEADPPKEEGSDNQDALLQVVRKMLWDEWGVEVTEI